MNKYFQLLTFHLSLAILVSCTTRLNISDYVDKNLPLKLTVTNTDTVTHLTTANVFVIQVNSDKFKKIIQWGNENTNGWQASYASYNAQISITQNNFRLLRINNGVVIGFTEKDGKPKQYSKAIKVDELKFLSD